MSESLQLPDPLFRLTIRFANGETVQHMMTDPLDSRTIAPEIKYAIVSSYSCQDPSLGAEVAVINLRDVSYIKTERVTLDQLAGEHRIGMRAAGVGDDRLPKHLAQIKFV